ncbi:MAG: metallophosphoesterase [Phycisphaerae bacterium]|nr:metallophosphoesterase [Phycisphaerae bacterium]
MDRLKPVVLAIIGTVVVLIVACVVDQDVPLPADQSDQNAPAGLVLVARFAQLTDTHVVDEESPARIAGAYGLTDAAWRPHEAYSTQLLDGMVRAVNRIHASGRTVDFLLHTGDAVDNVQTNELAWVVDIFDGGTINPLSGPDDREPADIPTAALDPHAPFQAQGLYRNGVHGDLPTIPWYAVLGNHDVRAVGVFPIYEDANGYRSAPLPLDIRPGLVLPVYLDPVSDIAYGNVTLAEPGPPDLFGPPRAVVANGERRFFNKTEFVATMFATQTAPSGHGFADAPPARTWYSTSPVAGLRLIGLDTTDARAAYFTGFYDQGAISREQFGFLRAELDAAADRGEIVIVATHHPSATLSPSAGSEIDGETFRALLSKHPGVVLHIAGHRHRHRVMDRGTYLEIETAASIDTPQEARLIELWRPPATGELVITYSVFSHLDDTLPPLGADPLQPMRVAAATLAKNDSPSLLAEPREPIDDDGSGAQLPPREAEVRMRSVERRR